MIAAEPSIIEWLLNHRVDRQRVAVVGWAARGWCAARCMLLSSS